MKSNKPEPTTKSERGECEQNAHIERQRHIDCRTAESIVQLPDLIIFKGQSDARKTCLHFTAACLILTASVTEPGGISSMWRPLGSAHPDALGSPDYTGSSSFLEPCHGITLPHFGSTLVSGKMMFT